MAFSIPYIWDSAYTFQNAYNWRLLFIFKLKYIWSFQAWLKLIDLTENKIEMVSQWGIGHKGKGAVFFKQLANGNNANINGSRSIPVVI